MIGFIKIQQGMYQQALLLSNLYGFNMNLPKPSSPCSRKHTKIQISKVEKNYTWKW